jgi:hydrogenase/urease accessory protein HupE
VWSTRLCKIGFRLGLLTLLLGSPTSAWAHAEIGQAANFSAGFHHPLSGWDHLLVMLAVGVWAAQRRGRYVWLLPLSFVGVMTVGGLVGSTGVSVPGVEGMILLSVIVFGLVVLLRVRLRASASVLLVASFAFFHGFAHGHEMPASASLFSFALGFVIATLLLHGGGILVLSGVVMIVGILVTTPATGQDAAVETAPASSEQEQENQATVAEVVVTGLAGELIGEASSASEGRVGAADLADRPILRRGELLEVVPGLVVTQHSGDGKANQYFLRGFNLDHGTDFNISVDVMPVNLRTHAHGQGYSDLNFIIPELVQSIDYQKGPFYPKIGDFSGAGAAGFVLVNAVPRGLFLNSLGENFYLRTLLADTWRAGPGQLTAAFEYTHYDGPWDRAANANRFNGFARYFWDHEEDHFRLTLMAYHASWNSTDQVAERAIDRGLIDRFGTLDGSDGGCSDRYSVAFNWIRDQGNTQTQANFYAIYYRLNLFSNFTYFLDDPVHGDQFEQVDRRVVLGGALSRTWSDKWFGYRVENTLGLQIRDDIIPDIALIHTESRRQLNTIRRDKVNEFSIGVYAQNEFHWTDWLRTRAGVRGDIYNFDVSSSLSKNSGNVWDGIASPKFTLILDPGFKTEFYLDLGMGFHSNDARGVTATVEPVTHRKIRSAAPLVRTRGAELGVRTEALPGLVSTLALWFLESDSELVFAGDTGTTDAAGKSRRYGVEWANFYKPTSWLTLDADLAFTHARFVDNPAGRYIPNSISTVVTAGVTLDSGRGPFAGFRTRYFGPQPLIEDNSARAPASLVFDARLGYRWKNYEFYVDVLNVFDAEVNDIEYFYTSRLPGEPVGGVDDFHLHPAEPRTVRATFTMYF